MKKLFLLLSLLIIVTACRTQKTSTMQSQQNYSDSCVATVTEQFSIADSIKKFISFEADTIDVWVTQESVLLAQDSLCGQRAQEVFKTSAHVKITKPKAKSGTEEVAKSEGAHTVSTSSASNYNAFQDESTDESKIVVSDPPDMTWVFIVIAVIFAIFLYFKFR